MESLPLELQDLIFSYLLPKVDRITVTAIPVSSHVARADVYSVRLVSRSLSTASLKVFAKLIEDVPTRCASEVNMSKLSDLVLQDHIKDHITSLAFDTSKLFIGESHEEQTLPFLRFNNDLQSDWLTSEGFQDLFAAFYAHLPRLQHLVCVASTMSGVQAASFGVRRAIALHRLSSIAADPLIHLHQAIEKSRLNEKIKTFLLLTKASAQQSLEVTSPAAEDPLLLPHLDHLTIGAACHELSGFRVRATNLTSLHILLSTHNFTLNLPLSEMAPRLQSLSLRGQHESLPQETFWQALETATAHLSNIQSYSSHGESRVRSCAHMFHGRDHHEWAERSKGNRSELFVFERRRTCNQADELSRIGNDRDGEADMHN
ncbi:hypothetical protein ACN47E_001392 [Coniothyrium glycines]